MPEDKQLWMIHHEFSPLFLGMREGDFIEFEKHPFMGYTDPDHYVMRIGIVGREEDLLMTLRRFSYELETMIKRCENEFAKKRADASS